MNNKYYKKRIVFVEVGGISFALPKNFEVKDIPMFLNSKEFEAFIDSKKIHKVIDEDSSFTQKELEIFEERDSSVWKPGSSHLIEDYESLEKYMADINHNPKLMGSNFYESFTFLRDAKTFVNLHHSYPLNSSIFVEYIELLKESDFFLNQAGQYFVDSSLEFLRALDQVKGINYNFNYYDLLFGDSINKFGLPIEKEQFSWLYNNAAHIWNQKREAEVVLQLNKLVNGKQFSKIEFLIKKDKVLKALFDKYFKNNKNVTKKILKLLNKKGSKDEN